MNFKENPSNGSQHTPEKAHCSSSAINYWPVANTLARFVAHACRLRSKNLQKNRSNGSRHTAEKAHRSQVMCP
jgi:hypothetical protein